MVSGEPAYLMRNAELGMRKDERRGTTDYADVGGLLACCRTQDTAKDRLPNSARERANNPSSSV